MKPGDLEDCFVPNKRNNYAPHVLQKAAVLGMVVLVFLSFTVANVQSLLWISSEWMISTILPAVIVDLTNDERSDGSLGTLRRNATLDEAARMKAEHMAANQYFAHYSPEGISPWYWFGEAHYNFVHAGENLAIHFTDSGDVVEAWMESPTHRANIMNGNYTEIGVGTAEGTYEGYPTVYVVQLFGTPAAIAQQDERNTEPEQSVLALEETPKEESVLAESVTLTEEVVIHEAEPIAVAVAEEVPAEADGADATSSREAVVITEMEETSHGIALYSDHIATSTGGVPATLTETGDTGEHAPVFWKLLTQPHVVLEILYGVIGLFVLVSLLISIAIEARHQHPVQITYGFALLAIMGGLYYVHMLVGGGALIL